MNFLGNTSINKKSNVFIKVFLAFIFLFVFVGLLNIFQSPIKNSFYILSSPIDRVLWRAGSSTSVFFTSLINAKSIGEENENLKSENQDLLIKIAALQEAERQRGAVNEMLANDPQNEFKFILAEVSGLNSSQDIASINKGSADGILEDMPVISRQKVLFGKVSKVFKNFSEVEMISNKNNVLNVKIQNNDPSAVPIYGVVRGGGNLGIYLDMVPVDSKINKDDVLVTSALEGIFPRDLLVGRIKETGKNDLKPFQTIKIEPFFNVQGADNLFVITDYKR